MKVKSSDISDDPAQDVTRRHLLEAAGEVFAEVGFRDATVREICQRAGANVAAINYHFGDKENLYEEVLRYAQGKALEKYPLLLGVAETAPPEEKLHAFVLSILSRIFDKGPTSWHGRLMSREMIEPTAVLDSLMEERIRPLSDTLRKIVAEILRCPLTDERVGSCAISVVSQCVFYKHCRPVVIRLFPEHLPDDPAAIAKLAAHITRFSLVAMRDYSVKKA
ncbi:MAG TPA: CerR family C-terminal domain-containing protein [Candidatus Acidoferrum sp.]|nr:CerR family C-terminal domain-containing protein [Candidatus Acidoferrum sp.]